MTSSTGTSLRRGSPNVAATYRNAALQRGASPVAADHAGACAAILAGDLALAGVYQVIRSLPISEALHRELHCVVDQAIFASVGGELFDIESSLGQDMPPLEEILNTARHKTSAYSFEAPPHAGAILAGAPRTGEIRAGVFWPVRRHRLSDCRRCAGRVRRAKPNRQIPLG
ncbi:polyprenyl synthetase family protein [Glutamicibacter halophytocola]|uniref:polyprenyl synthetase family protein n=1 Tax=Glutamicibacter halophytocola TaxID=1933880 RepID=UPI003219B0D0